MKRIILNFLVAIIAFCIGFCLHNLFHIDFITYKPFGKEEVKVVELEPKFAKTVKPQKNKESVNLTFEPTGAIACGFDSHGYSASFRTSEVSDGTFVSSTIVTNLETGKSAQKRFRIELKKAEKIIELKPILDSDKEKIGEKAYFQAKEKVFLVKYYKSFSEYGGEYDLIIDEAESLRHIKAFEVYKLPKTILKENTDSDELFKKLK